MRIFGLLLKKNFLVRKKHWIQSSLVQIIVPLVLFLVGQTIRLVSNGIAVRIDHNTYYNSTSKEDILMMRGWRSLRIHYTPETDNTTSLMEYMAECMNRRHFGENSKIIISSDADEDTMVKKITTEQLNSSSSLGVVFENIAHDSLPKNMKYKIRSAYSLSPDLFDPAENANSSIFIVYGDPIVQIQFCLDEAIIRMASNKNGESPEMPKIRIQQMPYPPYTQADMGTTISGQIFPETIGFIFVIILCVEISYFANEKFIGINVLMAVNGISTAKSLLSWFTSAIIYSVTYLAPIVLIMKHFMPPYIIPFLFYGDPFLVWIILFINLCHIICFGYHLSSYFWKPAHGVFATFMFLIIMNNISQFASETAFKHALLYIGIIAPQIILRRMFEDITSYENKLVGIQWTNMFTVASSEAPAEASIGFMLIWSIIGIVFNFLMTLYIYGVKPGKYGVAKHGLFCFGSEKMNHSEDDDINLEESKERKPEYEDIPDGSLEAGIRIRNLTKAYVTSFPKKSTVHALQGISMDFYQGQITALLGHNGAGKTTMMSILSGLTSLSGGAVFIGNRNIKREPEAIRDNIGLCPQENMVFPDLTVYEQLHFFGTLKVKWMSKKDLDDEIEMLLKKVNLTAKRDTIPKQLSGGQKRRLCLAMAIIGNANVLILDEPTSGMDPESKREVRDIILKLRGEKTIIISTHDMEEADILGDRIAIMHTGKMRSYGTSMFLKKLYGDGQVEVTLSVEPTCDVSAVLHQLGVSAQILNQNEGKIVLAIPMSHSLPQYLDKLESLKVDLGITGMSVSMITLEQVFLRVTKDKNDNLDHNTYINFSHRVTGFPYFLQTFKAYMIKKIIFGKKNFFTLLRSLILPCLACIIMAVSYAEINTKDVPTRLSLDAYGSTEAIVKSNVPSFGEKYGTAVLDFGGNVNYIKSGSEASVTAALIHSAINDISKYRNKYIVSAEFNGTETNLTANAFFSGAARLSIPISVNILHNAILKKLTGNDSYTIETSVQQLPLTKSVMKQENVDGPMITLAIMVFLAPAVALYVTQPLEEIRTGVKRLQDMTGASRFTYWASMFIFDFLQFIVSAVLLLCSFIIVDTALDLRFYKGTEMAIFMGIMVLFGLSMLPLVYLASFMKKSLNTTIRLLSLVSIILAFVEIIFMVVQASWNNKIFQGFRDVQIVIFQFFPFVSFLYGHTSFFTIVSKNGRCRRMTEQMIAVACVGYDTVCCDRKCSNGDCDNPFPYFVENPMKGLPSLARSMYYFVGSSILFFLMIYVLEKGFIGKLLKKMKKKKDITDTIVEGIDELVLKERTLIAQEISKKMHGTSVRNENVFLVHDLKKNYGKVQAVKGISFRVKETECFGLLGVNGAGKSTTFRMLTGEENPDAGQMWLNNFSIDADESNYLQGIGYCPQQHAIIETLNAWDHLYLFARLRGIPQDEVEDVVTKWVTKVNLTRNAAQPSNTYSGGNKRRLNIAMSLIGNPSLVLMDEPTAGVDPAARRSLWNTLKTCQNSGQSVIFTSHSMEECEVLCNRLVIMVNGQVVCIGASQELKQRFGAGYNIHVKLLPSRNYEDVQQIKSRIESNFRCTLMDENFGFIGYHITDRAATWTSMYTLMNELKNNYQCIEDFAVLSSSLEQLFIQFARAPQTQVRPQIT